MNECNPPRSVSNRLQAVPSNMFAVAGQPDIDACSSSERRSNPKIAKVSETVWGGGGGEGRGWAAARPQSLAPVPSFLGSRSR